ncbi:hypothetical protein Tco_0817619 [Tanacetum coccineum]
MYDSWKSIMELYMMNRQHGRMILESVENGPLIWPLIEENKVTRPKKYSEFLLREAIQLDSDIKATNIILQGLPPEFYALVSNHKVAKELWERIQLLMQGTSLTKQEREYLGIAKAMPSSEPPNVVTHLETEINSDSNIIPYSYNDTVSDSCAQSVEIDHLKQTLSEHLKEKESLMQTVTLLKNDFKKEESRNIDRERLCNTPIKSQRSGIPLWGATS